MQWHLAYHNETLRIALQGAGVTLAVPVLFMVEDKLRDECCQPLWTPILYIVRDIVRRCYYLCIPLTHFQIL